MFAAYVEFFRQTKVFKQSKILGRDCCNIYTFEKLQIQNTVTVEAVDYICTSWNSEREVVEKLIWNFNQ